VISKKLQPFGTTIFSEMTKLAIEHGAINLAQGFPDFEGPPEMVEAACRALRSGENQYARSQGHPKLCAAVAAERARLGLEYAPMTEVAVFAGATEGIAASLIGLLEPGDEVILFEPFYDSYPASLAMAGAVPRYYTLRWPDLALDPERLGALFSTRTRALVLNTPHNPTGKVFSRAELEIIAELCRRHDVIVITDEVYEHLVYDDARHLPMAALDGMRERTLSLASVGKTFSFTGWKIGWATGPAPLIAAAQAAHQFLTFAVSTPMQLATAWALETLGQPFFDELRRSYTEKRDYLTAVLASRGFAPGRTRGAYFVMADFRALSSDDDRTFARYLTQEIGVAAIPPSVFYAGEPEEGRRLLRFAFCKKMETLRAAAERLGRLG
jgi:N-succinyldiaminopimelate aminotransferase